MPGMRRLWRLRAPGVLLALVLLVLAFSGSASAHELGGSRFDAPISLVFLFVGAGLTVALTALWLGTSGQTPEALGARRQLTTIPPPLASTLATVARVVFVAGVLVALGHGLLGKQVRAENLATVFVWPLWVVGVGLLAVLFGSPWRVLSPWRTLYDALTRIEGDEIAVLGAYPSWLGAWPALLGFVAGIGIVGNLTVIPRSPRLTVLVVTGYTLVMLLGGVAFGPRWFRQADTLAVLYRLFGRVAPIEGTRTNPHGYELEARPPWQGAMRPVSSLSLVVFIVATVYTISFDGFTSTPEFQTLLFATRDLVGLGPSAEVVFYLVGLGGFVGSFVLVSGLVQYSATGTWRAWQEAACAFAPTLVPITVAYEFAHNYPFVVRNLGQLLTVSTDLLFASTGEPVALLGWLSLPLFWGSQVVLIVAGHVVAVVAAHLVAVRRYETPTAARRGHLPLVALMVGYTVLSLWIISRPVVS